MSMTYLRLYFPVSFHARLASCQSPQEALTLPQACFLRLLTLSVPLHVLRKRISLSRVSLGATFEKQPSVRSAKVGGGTGRERLRAAAAVDEDEEEEAAADMLRDCRKDKRVLSRS